ncbi:hypothetical protein LINGRAHAP2_LOCUS1758 [Linum grandiflorum]
MSSSESSSSDELEFDEIELFHDELQLELDEMEAEESPPRRRQADAKIRHGNLQKAFPHVSSVVPSHSWGGVLEADPTFAKRRDVVSNYSISPELKITAALRMIAWGSTADSLDEYFQMAESTTLETLRRFCSAIVHVYGPEYLREPTREDLDKLLRKGAHRGFPGMIGSIDYMH